MSRIALRVAIILLSGAIILCAAGVGGASGSWELVCGRFGTRYSVYGTWYMVHLVRSMILGPRSILLGTLYMVHGIWHMVHGIWYMVGGRHYVLKWIPRHATIFLENHPPYFHSQAQAH